MTDFIETYNKDGNRVNIKPYEISVSLAKKVKDILDFSALTDSQLARVLGVPTNDISRYLGGEIPENKTVIAVINKLFRLWYEYENN